MDSKTPPALHPRLRTLLGNLRWRIRRYLTLDAFLAVLVVLLVAFWVGLAVDLVPARLGGSEMPRSARVGLFVLTVCAVGYALWRFLLSPILRRLPDDSLALLLERHHPQLGGRLVTAVQLSREKRSDDSHAAALLERVHEETVAQADQIDPGRVFRYRPLQLKAAIAAPLAIGVLLLWGSNPSVLSQGLQRLLLLSDQPWPRRADLRMVGVEVPLVKATDLPNSEAVRLINFEDRVARIAKGGAATLRIEARAEGAIVPEVCTVYYRSASGIRGQVNMKRVGRVREGYQSFVLDGPPLAGMTEDLMLTVQGLDDRLEDYKIVAVDAPNVAQVQIEATYPPYLRTPGIEGADLISDYQPGLRVREGTSVRFVGQTSTPVAFVEAAVTRGDTATEMVPVDVREDGSGFSFYLANLTVPTTIVLVPLDKDSIAPPSPYRYFLGVVADAPPEIQIRLRGIGPTVTSRVRIPIEGTTTDDYGVVNLRVNLAPVAEDVEPAVKISTNADREGAFRSIVDIRDLADAGEIKTPKPGEQYLLYGEVEDAYDLGGPHITRTELVRLEVVSPDDLLAALERRELGQRSRLENLIRETEQLRDALGRLQREGWTPEKSEVSPDVAMRLISPSKLQDNQNPASGTAVDRALQVLQLRIQQAELQAGKTSDELSGIAAALDDILLEMQNNRIDTPDRSERIVNRVRDPLKNVVSGTLAELQRQIKELLSLASNPQLGPQFAGVAVRTADQVLLELTEILQQMLDLESYNEVLDMVRGLLDNQEELIESTEKQQQQSLQDLFRGLDE